MNTVHNRETERKNRENTVNELEQIFREVTELNGEETEEELNMAIAQEQQGSRFSYCL